MISAGWILHNLVPTSKKMQFLDALKGIFAKYEYQILLENDLNRFLNQNDFFNRFKSIN